MSEHISLPVSDGSTMAAYVARPSEPGRAPGILVFQEAFGVNIHIRDVADRLARQGYLAIAPELYHRTGPGFEGSYTDFTAVMPHMKAMTPEGQISDVRAAHAWLVTQGAERIVAVGFCMGGRMAARAAAAVPLAAAVSFYGGDLPGIKSEVPAMNAPLLIVWGDRDAHIPPAQRAAFADELRANKKLFVECTFSEAGHGFFCDQRESYHAGSAKLAWNLLLDFLAHPPA